MSDEVDILIKKLAAEADSRQRQTLLTGKLAGKSGKEFDKLSKEIKTAAANYTKHNKEDKEATKNLKNVNKELKEVEKGLDKFDSELRKAKEALKPFKTSIMALGDATGEGTKKLSNLFDMFSEFGASGGLISGVARSFDYIIETFTSLSQVGAQFGNDMLGMQRAANEARLPLGEFSALVQDNAPALASLFNTTAEGARQLVNFTKGVRAAAGDEGLYGLGITVEDLNDYMGTYLERQRYRGRAAQVSQQQVIEQTIKYTKELDLLAKLTGTSRKALDDQVKAQQADAIYQRAKNDMSEDQQTQADALIASLNDVNPALAEQAKSIMATGIGFGDLGNTLMGMNPELVETLRNFKGLVNNGKSATDIMGMLGESGRNFNAQFPDAAVFRFAEGAVGEVGAINQKLSTITAEKIEEERQNIKKMGEANRVLQPFRDGMKGLNAAFGELKVEFFQHIVPGITLFTEFITGPFKDTLLGFASFMQDNPKKTAMILLTGLGATILFDFAKQVLIVATGVRAAGGLMGGKGVAGGLGKNVAKAGGAMAGLGIAATGVGIAETAETNLGKSAGVGTAAAGGAITGAIIGSAIPIVGTAIGAAVGGLIGGGIAAYKGWFDENSRALGTLGATGSVIEPVDRMLKIHKGERVLDTGEASTYNTAQNTSSDAISKAIATLNQTNSQMLEKLNMLVIIESATEKNTKLTNRVIASGGADLIAG